ncbi:MAG: hypothetical protein QG577_343, partial [Thermodesulfobacteriota bacterium]|nr:hypothetical protein [Thermodesulfobacteriota bacterium]
MLCVIQPAVTVCVYTICHLYSQEEVMKILRALLIIAALTL